MNRTSIILVVCLAGCFSVPEGGTSKYMVPADEPGLTTPPAGKAMVVFFRPSLGRYAETPTVLDGNGSFICQMPAKGYVRHVTSPGKHRYVVWASGTPVLEAEFATGRTYFVNIDYPWFSFHMLAVKPGSSDWGKKDDWLNESKEWVVTEKHTRDWTKQYSDRIAEQLKLANEKWAAYDAKKRAARTITTDDGR